MLAGEPPALRRRFMGRGRQIHSPPPLCELKNVPDGKTIHRVRSDEEDECQNQDDGHGKH
jgi:hypothetical protein